MDDDIRIEIKPLTLSKAVDYLLTNRPIYCAFPNGTEGIIRTDSDGDYIWQVTVGWAAGVTETICSQGQEDFLTRNFLKDATLTILEGVY